MGTALPIQPVDICESQRILQLLRTVLALPIQPVDICESHRILQLLRTVLFWSHSGR